MASAGVAAVAAVALLSGGWWSKERSGAEAAQVVTARTTPVVVSAQSEPIAAPPADPAPEVAPPPEQDPVTPVQENVSLPTVRLYTRTWANVREARGTRSEVVLILQPGVEIEVADRQSHWWAVIERGERLGYVANSVLTADPADVVAAPELLSRGN